MRVDWFIVLMLGLTGAFMGIASLFAFWGAPIEFALWTALGALAWTPLLVGRRCERPILTGALGGLASGVGAGGVQALFLGTYVANRAGEGLVADAPTAAIFFGSALGVGVVWGALFGAIAWGILRRKARANAASAA